MSASDRARCVVEKQSRIVATLLSALRFSSLGTLLSDMFWLRRFPLSGIDNHRSQHNSGVWPKRRREIDGRASRCYTIAYPDLNPAIRDNNLLVQGRKDLSVLSAAQRHAITGILPPITSPFDKGGALDAGGFAEQ